MSAAPSSTQTLIYSRSAEQLEVYQVTHPDGQVTCHRTQRFHSSEDCKEEYDRFMLQQRLAHPNICRIFNAVCEEKAGIWVLDVDLEWCGKDLECLTHNQYREGWDEAAVGQVLFQVTSALSYAQQAEVCHRDIKPSNLFLSEDGWVKIGDFGCAKKTFDSGMMGHTMAGTPLFLSPVLRQAFTMQLLGQQVGPVTHDPYKSDVYSLGLSLVYLLKPSSMSILGNQTELSNTISGLSIHPTFRTILSSMLDVNEPTRPDFIALNTTLNSLQETQEVKPSPPPESESVKKRRFRITKKKTQEESPSPIQESGSAVAAVESRPSLCEVCSEAFLLVATEPWRLELLGSAYSEQAKRYCSERCYRQHSSEAPREAFRDEDPEEMEGRTGYRVAYVVPILEQFYHCFQHLGSGPLWMSYTRTAPFILPPCPDCPKPDCTRVRSPLSGFKIVTNPLYDGLVFISISATYKIYSSVVQPVLMEGRCHICSKPANPTNYLCYEHNHNLALICSPHCLQAALNTPDCSICGAPNILPEGSFPPSGFLFFSCIQEQSCLLCVCGESEYMLHCGHGFCRRCLGYIPRTDFPKFACFYCGAKFEKIDYPELFLD